MFLFSSPRLLSILLEALAAYAPVTAGPDTVLVGPGVYRPLYAQSPSEKEIAVGAFRLDRRAITNGEYLSFVLAEPRWRRDRVERVFAEAGYLSRWAAPDELGDGVPAGSPVTEVSWFAARAYCDWRGMRLPTEAEWELAASASPTETDATRDAAWRSELLAVYSRPPGAALPREALAPNAWGARELHGVVWEWVSDFNGVLGAGGEGGDSLRFCAGAASGARDKEDFPAFERVAFRNSLHADYTLRNLGFRCAMQAAPGAHP